MSRGSFRSVYSYTVPRNFDTDSRFFIYSHCIAVACFDQGIPRERVIGVLLTPKNGIIDLIFNLWHFSFFLFFFGWAIFHRYKI